MHKPKIKIGDKFHRLTVIGIAFKITNDIQKRRRHYECVCECGITRTVPAYMLNTRQIRSCGCDNHLLKTKGAKFDSQMASFRAKVSHYKSNAKRTNKEFALSYEETVQIFKTDCHYCGAPPSTDFTVQNTRRKKTKRILMNLEKIEDYAVKVNGIDRVDSYKGYIQNNVVPCCKTCNFAKNDLSYDEFINYIDRLIKFRSIKCLK